MPKGKGLMGAGIENAFDADIKHVQNQTKSKNETLDPPEANDNFKRVTISLTPSLLKKLDNVVKEQKARGASVNRSSFIADAVLQKIEEDM